MGRRRKGLDSGGRRGRESGRSISGRSRGGAELAREPQGEDGDDDNDDDGDDEGDDEDLLAGRPLVVGGVLHLLDTLLDEYVGLVLGGNDEKEEGWVAERSRGGEELRRRGRGEKRRRR